MHSVARSNVPRSLLVPLLVAGVAGGCVPSRTTHVVLASESTHRKSDGRVDAVEVATTPVRAPLGPAVHLAAETGAMCHVDSDGRVECRDFAWRSLPLATSVPHAEGLVFLDGRLGAFDGTTLHWPLVRVPWGADPVLGESVHVDEARRALEADAFDTLGRDVDDRTFELALGDLVRGGPRAGARPITLPGGVAHVSRVDGEVFVCTDASTTCVVLHPQGHDAIAATYVPWVDAAARALPPPRSIRSENGFGCAWGDDGEVRCWGALGYGPVRRTPPGTLDGPVPAALRIGLGRVCRLDAGRLACARRDAERPSELRFVERATHVRRFVTLEPALCATLTNGRVECDGLVSDAWERGEALDAAIADEHGLITDAVDVGFGGDTLCVVRTRGRVRCWSLEDDRMGLRMQATPAELPTLPWLRELFATGTELRLIASDARVYGFDEIGSLRRYSDLDGGPWATYDGTPVRLERDQLIGGAAYASIRWRPWSELPTLHATGDGSVEGAHVVESDPPIVCLEERGPFELVCYANRAARAGFTDDRARLRARHERVRRIASRPRLLERPFAEARIYTTTSHDVTYESNDELCKDETASSTSRGDCPDLASRGVVLARADAIDVEERVRDPDSYTPVRDRCYQPHHEIIYFDAHGAIIARVEICFECEQVRTSPDVEGDADFGTFRSLGVFRRLCVRAGLEGCERGPD